MPKFARFAAILMASAPVLAGTPAHAQPAAPQQAPASAADLQLRALYNGYSEWAAKEGGYFETAEGEQKQSDYLPRVDASTQQQQAAHLQGLLNQLNAIPANQLSPSEQVNAAVFRTVLENSLIEAKYRTFEMPFNSDSSFWTYLDENQQLRDADEYRRYIARMRAREEAVRPQFRIQPDERARGNQLRAQPVVLGLRAVAPDDALGLGQPRYLRHPLAQRAVAHPSRCIRLVNGGNGCVHRESLSRRQTAQRRLGRGHESTVSREF